VSEVPVRLAPKPLVTESAVGTPPPLHPTDETVHLTIDGREVEAKKGELLIDVAERAGAYIPRFCYHPRMKPVGMCRMCLVEVTGPRGASLMPACYNAVADGMEVQTQSPMAKKAQDGVIEFLLVNHPLDCPVCDKGGECPLQDQTLAYGPGESRFIEEKRHWEKPIPISELVNLDRERCIQCGRCVRFADEVAGDPLIDFYERGDLTEVAVFADTNPFSSYFSGNIVQICPVGALTATPYRFRARPWDLEQVESSCTSCSIGCRMAVQSSSDELVRNIGIDNDPVNWSWLCDKGRFDYQAVNSDERLTVPLVRRGEELVETGWGEALSLVAEKLGAAGKEGSGVGIVGGARLANEDAYAWAKLARVALGTDNVDAQLGDGLPAEVVAALPRATIDQAAAAPLVVTVSGDIKEELPILYLRLRHAAREQGLQICELTPATTGLSRESAVTARYTPGQLADAITALFADEDPVEGAGGVSRDDLLAVRAHLRRAVSAAPAGTPPVVVVLGRPSLAEPADGVLAAAAAFRRIPGVRFLSALRRSNVHGAIDLGLAPGLLPGRVALSDGTAWYEQQWGVGLPTAPGLDTAGMLAAAANGRLGALVLLGADPVTDFPDRRAALAGVEGAGFVVAVDTFLTESSRRADVVLPAATFAERRGTFTNLEGRVSHLGAIVTAPGVAWPDWTIASELGWRLGVDLGFSSLEEIWAEIATVSPLHQGIKYADLSGPEGSDGVVVPRRAGHEPGRPRSLDPMADPGIASAEMHAYAPTSIAATYRRTVDDDEPGGATEGLPPMISWLGVPPAPSATAATGDGLALVSRRKLWDAGTKVERSGSLAPLAERTAARLHPDDLARLGVAEGSPVTLRTPRGELTVPALGDPSVTPGSVSVPFNLPGGAAAQLIDRAAPVVTVQISPAVSSPTEPAGGAA